jgi:ATP-dependent RNA helicase DeaD
MSQSTSPEPVSVAPLPTFDALPLSPDVRKAVDALGWVHPTPVQRAVLEPAGRGKNLVVQARTGTGKTGAFGLPIVDTLVKKSLPKVQALVLTPTRELALQVARELEQLAQFRELKIVAIYGGAPMGRQIEALEQGAQIVSGTPGRVLDHIRRRTLDTSNVKIFVLDEADEMLSMGFAKELHAIAEALPKERQGLFFSATIPPDIERLAVAQLRDPEFITLSSDQVGALEIQHFVYMVRGGHDKRQALVRILEVEDPESAIVFCNTKDETERLAEQLKNAGYDAEWLNGDLEQRERERIMQKTREGKCRFLVATDVAARGIDISHLTHVINADFPEAAEQYVHRTGRTGRAGRTGTAISLVSPKDIGSLYILRLTYKIRPIEKELPTAGELKTRAEADIVQMFVEAFAARPADPNDLGVARRLFTHPDAERIVAGLVRDHLGAKPGDPAQLAAEGRRAKNPSFTPQAGTAGPERVQLADAHLDRERGRRERERGRERERDRERERERGLAKGAKDQRVPHASFATWEPAPEQDDDRPILPEAHAPSARTPHDIPPADLPGFTESRAPSGREPREREEDEPGFSQVFVNVGRREGVKPGDFVRLLEAAGIARTDAGRIKIRDRNSFVSVRTEVLDRAVAALVGHSLGGRTTNAEPAKRAQAR